MFIKKILDLSCISFVVISLPLIAMENRIVVAGGKSVGDGFATGRACVVTKFDELKKICKGNIVIASSTNKSWNTALKLSAGIITEEGGSNSHAAQLGKKLGIPVIVGVGEATKKIVDGSTISLDCAKREVYEMAENTSALFRVDKPHSSTIFQDYGQESYGFSSVYDGSLVVNSNTQKNHCSFLLDNKKQQKYTITKDFYTQQFKEFQAYVLNMQYRLSWGRWANAVEWGAQKAGCDSFAVDCIALSYPFFDYDKKSIVSTLKSLSSDDYVKQMDSLFEKCNQKPGDLNWVARMSHQSAVEAIQLSSDIEKDKEKLIAEPKEYKKIIEEEKVAKEEHNLQVALGLFVRYCVEKNISF